METSQVVVALIGAFSTLLAALLNSLSRRKSGVAQPKRSLKRTILKFSFYFLLGGGATYWVMNSVLPFGRIEERLKLLEAQSASSISFRGGNGPGADSLPFSTWPVGSVILSVLPPEKFQLMTSASERWVPADGRTLDPTSRYVALSGHSAVPILPPLKIGLADSLVRADSLVHRIGIREPGSEGRGEVAYWYIRVN